jgi:hypothetical protein
VGRRVVWWYRATCFGKPVGPWRDSARDVKRDLIAQGLGSYDEWNAFYITVPGGVDKRSAWIETSNAA